MAQYAAANLVNFVLYCSRPIEDSSVWQQFHQLAYSRKCAIEPVSSCTNSGREAEVLLALPAEIVALCPLDRTQFEEAVSEEHHGLAISKFVALCERVRVELLLRPEHCVRLARARLAVA